jgi:membrane-associated phospholipid phosphatase
MAKKFIVCLVLLGVFCLNLHAEDETVEDEATEAAFHPVTLAFHNMGRNALDAVAYNYGVNFIGAGLETWALIETGLDWKWRNIAYDNTWLSNCGGPGIYIGFIVPALTPFAAYIAGRSTNNEKLQITGLAVAQSVMLTLAIQTPLKMITGRATPGITRGWFYDRSQRTDDFSGEFNWFNMDFVAGWPSGHTANAFSVAATIAELYKDNLWIKIGAYSYAALIGFGVTLNVHWTSEMLAGALIGYAVGKTVGKSFNELLENNVSDNPVSFYVVPNALGVIIRL